MTILTIRHQWNHSASHVPKSSYTALIRSLTLSLSLLSPSPPQNSAWSAQIAFSISYQKPIIRASSQGASSIRAHKQIWIIGLSCHRHREWKATPVTLSLSFSIYLFGQMGEQCFAKKIAHVTRSLVQRIPWREILVHLSPWGRPIYKLFCRTML